MKSAKIVRLAAKTIHVLKLNGEPLNNKNCLVDQGLSMSTILCEETAETALKNPLVLDITFLYLTVPELKSARVVCRDWADVWATVLKKKTALQISKMFRCCKIVSEDKHVDPRLARRLKIYPKCLCEMNPSVMDRALPYNFDALVPRIFNQVDTMSLYSIDAGFMAHFLNMTKFSSFSILRKVVVVCLHESDLEMDCAAFRKTPCPSIKSLTFDVILVDDTPKLGLNVFQSFFQFLVDSSPNLKDLKMKNAVYSLDLGNCQKIEKLLYLRSRHLDGINGSEQGVNLRILIKILRSIRNSVSNLALAYDVLGSYEHQSLSIPLAEVKKLSMPIMSNLASLTISHTNVFCIGLWLDDIHFPKLRHLTIDLDCSSTGEAFKNFSLPHHGLTSLKMNVLDCTTSADRQQFKRMVGLFDGIQSFDLEFGLAAVGLITESGFQSIVKSCELWKLSTLNIRYTGMNILRLRILSGCKALKSITLDASYDYEGRKDDSQFRFTKNMKKAFKTCKKYEYVQFKGFLVEEQTLEEIKRFCEVEELPITFLFTTTITAADFE